ncbi:MAG: hypothetical protein JWR85_161 [Marmoricola sp.]|nr:hypothetical protein [Marmoricola sp.]
MSHAPDEEHQPQSVSVFGSCVTRDNFNSRFNPGYRRYFEVKLSANQTSMIALMSPPIEDAFTPLREMTDYDRWNISSDLTREFLPLLADLQPDLLILDFFGDVHFGVARLPDGRYLTDNRWKTHHTDFYTRHQQAGDLAIFKHAADPDAYFALWTEAMDRFADYVARTCPDTRVVVHRGYNAGRVQVPGRPRPIPLRKHRKSAQLDVQAANAFWSRLDDYAISTHGWDSIDLRDLEAPTYVGHPWGAFYVHYTPDYYHRFLAELHKLSLRHRLDPASYAEVELIEAASREPAERRLAVAEAIVTDQGTRLERLRARVEDLETLGLVRGVRFALGQRVRARRAARSQRADS